MQEGKVVVWGGRTNSWEKRNERHRRKGKIYPTECRVPQNSKNRFKKKKKKGFISEHAKTRNLFKKIRDSKGTFYASMGTTKDRSSMDLTEPEEIKKR